MGTGEISPIRALETLGRAACVYLCYIFLLRVKSITRNRESSLTGASDFRYNVNNVVGMTLTSEGLTLKLPQDAGLLSLVKTLTTTYYQPREYGV